MWVALQSSHLRLLNQQFQTLGYHFVKFFLIYSYAFIFVCLRVGIYSAFCRGHNAVKNQVPHEASNDHIIYWKTCVTIDGCMGCLVLGCIKATIAHNAVYSFTNSNFSDLNNNPLALFFLNPEYVSFFLNPEYVPFTLMIH